MGSTDDSTPRKGHTESVQLLGKSVNWLVAALLVLGGALFGAVGIFLNSVASRAEIARLVAQGTIESGALTEIELVNVTYALVWWGGLGLAAIGALLIASGVGFLLYRRRTRQRRMERDATSPATTTAAVVGAAVTIVASFLPFSPIFGGVVAGYLEHGGRMRSVRVGGLSGIVASVPITVIFVFLIGGLFVASAEVSLGVGWGVVVLVSGVLLLSAVVYMVLLGALGGYVGAYIRDGRSPADEVHSPFS